MRQNLFFILAFGGIAATIGCNQEASTSIPVQPGSNRADLPPSPSFSGAAQIPPSAHDDPSQPAALQLTPEQRKELFGALEEAEA